MINEMYICSRKKQGVNLTQRFSFYTNTLFQDSAEFRSILWVLLVFCETLGTFFYAQNLK